jgi:hypothetical protein
MEAMLMIKRREVISINLVPFKEEEDVVEEMVEQEKGNRQQGESEFVSHVPLPDEKVIK